MNLKILVVTQWQFYDGLIQAYTLPYLKIIRKLRPEATIYLITEEKSGKLDGDSLLGIQASLASDHITIIPNRYASFGFRKVLRLALNLARDIAFIFSKEIDVIHTFCTPAGGYGYMLSLATFRPHVVDSFEPHSQYMKDAGVWSKRSIAYRLLYFFERRQALHASHLIATTPAVITYITNELGVERKRTFVKPACVDLEKFSYNENNANQKKAELGLHNKIIGIYAGKFGDFYLEEEIFQLFKAGFQTWPDRFHGILLSTIKEELLNSYCEEYEIDRNRLTWKVVPHHDMPVYLSIADFALAPYKPTLSKRYCTPIKDGEYWAMGLPVIITAGISEDSELIKEFDIGYVLEDLNEHEYLKAMTKIDLLLKTDRFSLRQKIRLLAQNKRSLKGAEEIYSNIYT